MIGNVGVMTTTHIASAREVPPEVPLPPPEKPEREPQRNPAYERPTLAVSEASVWVSDLRRQVRDFAVADNPALKISVAFAEGGKVNVSDVEAGPGAEYVTVIQAESQTRLIVRLDQIIRVDLTPTRADAPDRFRGHAGAIGFGSGAAGQPRTTPRRDAAAPS